ncbi:hypothetical protein V6N13_133366 [Hibiscus sabdariffa]
MVPTSLGLASLLTPASSSTYRLRVKFHLSLQSWVLIKETTRHSMKGFTSGGQALLPYLCCREKKKILFGDDDPCKMDGAARELVQPSAFVSTSPPSLTVHTETSSDYPTTPKPPHSSVCSLFESPTLLSLLCLRVNRRRCLV